MHKRISIDPSTLSGQACVTGTMIPVFHVLRLLHGGQTIEGILKKYPTLTKEDIQACIDYAAALAEG